MALFLLNQAEMHVREPGLEVQQCRGFLVPQEFETYGKVGWEHFT